MLTRGETIKAFECCYMTHNCGGCPFDEQGKWACSAESEINKAVMHYLKENEPAPAATGTSSEVSKDTDNIHIDDSVKTQICQEAQKAYKACELILDIYERMEDEEQKAFDMGQSYRAMLEVKEELTRIGNGGDNNG